MARKPTPSRVERDRAKEDARPEPGEIDQGGELVREEQPAITIVHAEVVPGERKTDDALDARLADLEKELAANRRRVEDAERRAAEAEALAARNAGQAQTSQDAALRNYEASVTNALTAAKTELVGAKKAYAAAMESGDFNAAAEAQEAIAGAKQSQLIYEAEQRKIDDYKKNPPPPAASQPASGRPRDTIDLRQMPRRAREYLEDHPEYLDDTRLWNKLSRAHADALDDGMDPYGDEYFAFLDGRMGGGKRVTTREEPRRERRQSADDSALPPSREQQGSGTRNATEVSLTAREVEAAHFSFPELSHREAEVAYAEQKMRLVNEGRIGTKH